MEPLKALRLEEVTTTLELKTITTLHSRLTQRLKVGRCPKKSPKRNLKSLMLFTMIILTTQIMKK